MNTCIALGLEYRTVVLYSHLIPVAIALLLAIFVMSKARHLLLSKIFTLFIGFFCLWLLGDIVLWGTIPDYDLVAAIWSLMDYFNVVFYLLAAYFFSVLVRGKDVPLWQKFILFALSIPAWWITISGQSILDFYQPWCEATNNEWLTQYKLGVEVAVLAFIMLYGTFAFFAGDRTKRKQVSLVGMALVLFLGIFASTEYISSVTGLYEINLYSLFVLPVFLAMIIFSITNLKIFAYRALGMQLLIYLLLIMVGSQFFLLHDATYRALTLITFGLSLFLGIVLVRNISREEKLVEELELANEGQANLLHIINHQIKGYMTKARLVFDDLLNDQSYNLSDSSKPMIKQGFDSMTEGVDFVRDFLNASNIEKGTFSYNMTPLDLSQIVSEQSTPQESAAKSKGLSYKLTLGPGDYKMTGDALQLSQAVKNLIDNSIRYTPQGEIAVSLERRGDKILFSVSDTGVGISKDLWPKLFTKGGRDKDSQKINVNSTGFGLAFVKGVAQAHNGRVWAESAGTNQGAVFYMELPVT